MNQQGVIQPIGGVNEKIEGFYDVCRVRGLTGTQGVLIPIENVEDLMLRDDVIEAVAAGKFHVHPSRAHRGGHRNPDRRPAAGSRDGQGRFPAGTVFARVDDRLRQMAATLKKYD